MRYKIADGYYLYRDKFKFAVEPATVKLGAAQFPQGDVHNDEFFGKVETYRKELRIRLPFTRDASTNKLKLRSPPRAAPMSVCATCRSSKRPTSKFPPPAAPPSRPCLRPAQAA